MKRNNPSEYIENTYIDLEINGFALDHLDEFGIFAVAKDFVNFMVRLRSSLRRFQHTMQSTTHRSIEQINLNAKHTHYTLSKMSARETFLDIALNFQNICFALDLNLKRVVGDRGFRR